MNRDITELLNREGCYVANCPFPKKGPGYL